LKSLTPISDQQWHKVRLFFGEHLDEFLEISHTSASKKVEQPIVAVTWLWNVSKVFFLCPRDTFNSSKFTDKRNISINTVQQLNTIDRQLADLSFV